MKNIRLLKVVFSYMKPLKLQKKNSPYKFKCDLYNDFDPNVHVVDFGVVIMHQLSSLREAF